MFPLGKQGSSWGPPLGLSVPPADVLSAIKSLSSGTCRCFFLGTWAVRFDCAPLAGCPLQGAFRHKSSFVI